MHLYRATVLFFVLLNVQTYARALEPVFSIGTEDDDTKEFLHAPDGYDEFRTESSYRLGSSTPGSNWSYVHPGPEDKWAGSREHAFSVLFGLNRSASDEEQVRLIIDCVEAHHELPPSVQISLNGQTVVKTKLSPGTAQNAVNGNLSHTQEQQISFDPPAKRLHDSLNRLQITSTEGSWFLYDHVTLLGPASLSSAEPPDKAILSYEVDPRVIETENGSIQPLKLNVYNRSNDSSIQLRTQDRSFSFDVKKNKNAIHVPLPVNEQKRQVSVHLMDENKPVQTIQFTQPPGQTTEPVDWVNPLAGTVNSRWMLFPGPTRPFGMVKLSPDSNTSHPTQQNFHQAGYRFNSNRITGFSHLRSWTLTGLLTMPGTGAPKTENDEYLSSFRHETEEASPGYYAVTLDDYDVRAELTSTTRTGFQRYTFPESNQSHILFDLYPPGEYEDEFIEGNVQAVSDHEIEGNAKLRVSGFGGGNSKNNTKHPYTVYFVARTNKPFDSMDAWNENGIQSDITHLSGQKKLGALLNFTTDEDEKILLQTGISLVSIASARNNLETETASFGWDFDACRQQARDEWNDLLGRVQIASHNPEIMTKFYSNFYRAYSGRTILSDVNGKYRDMKEEVQTTKTPLLTGDAFWNTFWNVNQLWTLATPTWMNNWVKSVLELYKVGGWLPFGPAGVEHTRIMVASHAIPLIVSAYQHGIRNFDTELAFEAMDHQQTSPGRQPFDNSGRAGNMELKPYPGQEDQGQMGGWYVMSAIGLFQVDGGCRSEPIYQIGSPVVDRAVITLDNEYYSGGRFIIKTYNNSKENRYIQSARLNGKKLNKPYIRAQNVFEGGKLELHMGPEPNRNWGSDPGDIPPSAFTD